MRHVTIYQAEGRYAGWPANYGIWAWGDEIVLGFIAGYHKDTNGGLHSRDCSRPFETLQARSLDGGMNWTVSPLPAQSPGGKALSADEHADAPLQFAGALHDENAFLTPQGIDFSTPELAILCARSGLNAGSVSWYYTSVNRCHSWDGPYRLPDMGLPGIAARTDYHILGAKRCLFFLTATGAVTERSSRVFAAETIDGGASFQFKGWVTPAFADGYQIMPASVMLEGGALVAVRAKDESINHSWIDLYRSDDNCRSFKKIAQPVMDTGAGGNPPTLTRLHDQRLCLTYGSRRNPCGIYAVFSGDDGATWSEPTLLRAGGDSFDIGYPRTVQLDSGTMVTAYYFTEQSGGAASIQATIWQP